ncbi:PKD domain-containing protein [Anaerolineales bacterium HSG6]|nr:PKD domain-containing protein [Anaerolineales bacterium HSG6]
MLRKKVVFSLALGLFSALSIFIILPQGTALAAGETCFAHIDGTTDYFTGTTAVQEAINVADENDLIKVAGNCTGGTTINGSTQTAYITESITVRGGYTNTNWNLSDFLAYPTTLTQIAGPVMVITGAGITPTIDSLIIREGQGGINVIDAEPILQNLVIEDNTDSGLTLNKADDTKVLTTTIQNNTTSNNGAGVYIVQSSSLLFQNVYILSNTATKNGGGLYMADAAQTSSTNMTIRDSQINGNTAVNNGGVLIKADDLVLKHTTIDGNSSKINGNLPLAGSFTCRIKSNDARLSHITVTNNWSEGHDGALHFEGNNSTLEYLTVTHNISVKGDHGDYSGNTDGGGIRLGPFNNSTLQYSTIMSNTVPRNGGGIYVAGSNSFTITNNILSYNTAKTGGGGGIHIDRDKNNNTDSDNYTITNNTITHNTAIAGGGGIYIASGNSYSITGNIITDNTASQDGGGIYTASGNDYTIINNIIAHNSANLEGSGLYLLGNNGNIYHNTLVGNSGGEGQAIYVNGNGFEVKNSIIVDHTRAVKFVITQTHKIVVDNNTYWNISHDTPISGIDDEGDNRECDPKFVNQAGRVYSLTNQSCTIDHGVDVEVTTDYEGNSRPQEYAPDAGAYESPFTPTLAIDFEGEQTGRLNQILAFTATIFPPILRNFAAVPITYSWSVDGLQNSGDTDQEIYSFGIGTHSVMVTVTDGITVISMTLPITITDPFTEVTGVKIEGPDQGFIDKYYTFQGVHTPSDATPQIGYIGKPKPHTGDGIAQKTYQFEFVGDHLITMEASNSPIRASDTHGITIYNLPTADFNTTPINSAGPAPLTIDFTNYAGNLDETDSRVSIQFEWNFGDGSAIDNSRHPSHTYVNTDTYTATLKVIKKLTSSSSGETAVATITKIITAHTPITTSFIATTPVTGTAPLEVTFRDTSIGDYDTLSWQYGDGTPTEITTTLKGYITHIYTIPDDKTVSTYTTELIASGLGGTDSYSRVITVYGVLDADFIMTSSTAYSIVTKTFDFQDKSSGQVDRLWDFGDGITSTEKFPDHTYTISGTYTIVLTVTGADGSTDTASKTINLFDPVKAIIDNGSPNQFPFVNNLVKYCSNSTGDVISLTWTTDNPDAEFSSPVVQSPNGSVCIDDIYKQTGTYPLTLTVYGKGGDTNAASYDIKPKGKPVISFTASPTAGTAPLKVEFTNTSTGDYNNVNWDFDSVCRDSTHKDPPPCTYNIAGEYIVTLMATGYDNKTYAYSQTITVNEAILAQFTTSAQSGIIPTSNTIIFTDTSQGGYYTITYEFGDGNTKILSKNDPPYPHTYTETGRYGVIITATGATDQQTSWPVITYVHIYQACEAGFEVSSNDIEALSTVVFTNTSDGSCQVQGWQYGDGAQTDQHTAQPHTYSVPGYYTPTLTMSGPGGTAVYTKPIKVWGTRCDFEGKNAVLTPTLSYGKDNLVLTYPPMKEFQQTRSDADCVAEVVWFTNDMPQGSNVGTMITDQRKAVITAELLSSSTAWQAEVRACNKNGCSDPPLISNRAVITEEPNTPPVVSTTIITPPLPLSTESLQVISQTYDKENDPVTTTTRWFRVPEQKYYQVLENPRKYNYGLPAYVDTDAVSRNSTHQDEIWCATISPNDGKIDGETTETCVMVGDDQNRPPMVTARLFQASSREVISNVLEATLTLEYEYFDDKDKEGTHRIRWYSNEKYQPKYIDDTTCLRVPIDKNPQNKNLYHCEIEPDTVFPGDSWFAIIQPNDTILDGLPIKTEPVIIQDVDGDNTPPTAKQVKILPPLVAKEDEPLLLDYLYEDADHHKETGSLIYWYETSKNPSILNRIRKLDGLRIIPEIHLLSDQIWYAIVTPKDGRNFGESVPAHTVRITKTSPPPTWYNVFIWPKNPGPTDTLRLSYIYPHPEENVYKIDHVETTWTWNGGEQLALKDKGEVEAELIKSGAIWCVTATAYDTVGKSTETEGPICVTIEQPANSLPTSEITPYILPVRPTNQPILVVNYAYFDLDNDIEDATKIQWYKKGEGQTSFVHQTEFNNKNQIYAPLTRSGEKWQATVQLHDGKDYGEIYTTASVTVNYIPTINPPPGGIMPTEIRAGEAVTIDYGSCTDLDGDLCTIGVRWYLESSSSSTRLSPSQADLDASGEDRCTAAVSLSNLLGQYNDELTLSANVTEEGQQLVACIWPNDGYQDGSIITASRVIATKIITKSSDIYLPTLLKNVTPPATATPIGSLTPTPGPDLTVEPRTIEFGPQMIGTPAMTQSFIVTSTGQRDLQITSLETTEDDFEIFEECPTPLQPQASCQIFVTFNPKTKGLRQAEVKIHSNAPGGLHTVKVSGEGLANPCTEDEGYEPNNSKPKACLIEFGKPIQAYPNDTYDLYWFEINETSSIKIEIHNFNANGGDGGQLQLNNSYDKEPIAENRYLKKSATLPNNSNPTAMTNLPPGKYFVLVYSHNPTEEDIPYTLEITR